MWRKYLLPSVASMAVMSYGITSYADNASNSEAENVAQDALVLKSKHKPEQRFIVKFKGENKSFHQSDNLLSPQQAEAELFQEVKASTLTSNGATHTKALNIINGFSIEADADTVKNLRNHPDIDFIEPDPIREFQAEVVPYGIQQIQADFLSDSGTGNMIICVADSGYELNHDDLPATANITGEISNTLLRDVDLGVWYEDSYGHGSHMAGTITAIGGNGIGTTGVHPSGNINLHIVKMIHNPNWWPVYGSDMISAVERCVDAGAKVINFSISGPQNSQAEEEAMQAAYDAGALIVSASGKFGSSEYFYPASYDAVISVSAIDDTENPWQFNQENDQVELVAAGVKVKSTTRNNGYGTWDGTSVATAYTSGGLALLWSHHPECTNQEIRHIAHQTAKDLGEVGRDEVFGFGTLQIKAASDLISEAGCDGIANEAPEISGSPEISVSVGDDYGFMPIATDADGDELMFLIENLPEWMQFDVTTGELIGSATTALVGEYADITISVSDGEFTRALPAFSITVVDSTFTEWVDKGEAYDITTWTPAINNQTSDFHQSNHYKQDQHRFEQKRKLDAATGIEVANGEAIEQVRTENRQDQRLVSVTWSGWSTFGNSYDFTAWSPNSASYSCTVSVNQSRSYKQDSQGMYNYYINGVLLTSRTVNTTDTLSDARNVLGDQPNWVPYTPDVEAWSASGGRYNYSGWSPSAGNQTSGYTQTRTYRQDYLRTIRYRERDTCSGAIRTVSSGSESDTSQRSESRSVSVTWSGWTPDGPAYGGTPWTPAASEYFCTDTFTQSQNYQQKYKGSYVHSNGYVRDVTKIETHTSSEVVKGSKPVYEALSPTYTGWVNDGSPYGYSAWSPAATTQTSSFTQTRTYKQNQKRYRQERRKNVCDGTVENVSSPVKETRVLNNSNSRSVSVSWTAWVNDGGLYGCSAFLPSTSTVLKGVSFMQSRECTQNLKRTRNYSSGESYTESGLPKIVNDTKNAVGTKEPYRWVNLGWKTEGASDNYSAVRNIFNEIQTTSVSIGSSCSNTGQVVVTQKAFEEEEDCDYGESCRYYYFISTKEAKCQ